MESLYVCLFSNGHIKVGRSSEASERIKQHVERVKCLGVHLARANRWDAFNALRAEADLIAKCAAKASERHGNEWFAGLDFDEVSQWAGDAANEVYPVKRTTGHLREYLQVPGAMPVKQLRDAMNALGADIRDDAQIRQWIAVDDEGNFKRQPGAAYAMFLERATHGRVTRQAMRPDDYADIWPDLAVS